MLVTISCSLLFVIPVSDIICKYILKYCKKNNILVHDIEADSGTRETLLLVAPVFFASTGDHCHTLYSMDLGVMNEHECLSIGGLVWTLSNAACALEGSVHVRLKITSII